MKTTYVGDEQLCPAKLRKDAHPVFQREDIDFSIFSREVWVEAWDLLQGGYYSISNNHRMLARLPPHQNTASDAVLLLKRANASRHDVDAWVDHMSIGSVVSQYLRCHCRKQDRLTVSREVYGAFRKLGGTTPNGFKCPEGRIHVPYDVIQALRDTEEEIIVQNGVYPTLGVVLTPQSQERRRIGIQRLGGLERLRKRLGLRTRKEDREAVKQAAKFGHEAGKTTRVGSPARVSFSIEHAQQLAGSLRRVLDEEHDAQDSLNITTLLNRLNGVR